ncbi:MAG: hypothetical protein NC416_00995 [Eubacterium sp.]|nr:hypothetical protein [Eubacterium sp.]
MDKYEYQIRSDEIKALIAEGEFAEAVKIADTIDWRRVRSVMMLCTISDLYKINRRYRESKDILLLAYEKHPTARSIVYSLCELSIKLEEYVQAIEYYKEFAQIAPKDSGRYILQYRLYEAQDVSLEERIEVLKEFKRHDYREKWAYELAYLYHRIGLATQCVEECDEMFIMFGEGKYIIKALELKALHAPLNEEQQVRYDEWVRMRNAGEDPEDMEAQTEDDSDDVEGDTQNAYRVGHAGEDGMVDEQEIPTVPTMELPEVKTVDVGQYNTINLQMALAESMKEILSDEEDSEEDAEIDSGEIPEDEEEISEVDDRTSGEVFYEDEEISGDEDEEVLYEDEEDSEDGDDDALYGDEEALYRNEEDSDDGDNEVLYGSGGISDEEEDDEENRQRSVAETLIAPLLEETQEMPTTEEVEEKLNATPVIAFPGKAERKPEESRASVQPKKKLSMDTDDLQEISTQIVQEDTASFDAQQIVNEMKQESRSPQGTEVSALAPDKIPGARTGVLTPLNTKPSKFDNILSQEYDGQISLVVPETERVEKQITGQLSIEDIMAEWEEVKKSNEQKRMEEVKQRILAHTGNLFADFDEATKNGLLEELERAFVAAIMKDSGKKPAIRKVVLPEDDEPAPSPKNGKPDVGKYVAAAVEEFEKEMAEGSLEDEDSLEEAGELRATGESIPENEEKKTAGIVAEEADRTAETGSERQGGETSEENWQDRELTPEEMELFGQFAHHRKSKKQLVHVLDNMSLASCTGNVIITGEEELTTLTLAKALIKEMQLNDSNFSGKVAKISASVLNKKDVAETFARLDNGALIIEKASRLKPATVAKVTKVLDKDNMGLLLLLIDRKQDINQLLADHSALKNNINLRVDIEPLDNEALVAYAKQYAEEQEYSIDEFGILALHTRIADRQTSDHEVSMSEVRNLVDEAIEYANKKTPKHFMDILLAKRYDEEDMIILREKDFMHY